MIADLQLKGPYVPADFFWSLLTPTQHAVVIARFREHIARMETRLAELRVLQAELEAKAKKESAS